MWPFKKVKQPSITVNDDTVKELVAALNAYTDNVSDLQSQLESIEKLWIRVGNRLDRAYYRAKPAEETPSSNGEDELNILLRKLGSNHG